MSTLNQFSSIEIFQELSLGYDENIDRIIDSNFINTYSQNNQQQNQRITGYYCSKTNTFFTIQQPLTHIPPNIVPQNQEQFQDMFADFTLSSDFCNLQTYPI